MAFVEGQTVGGRYTLERILGEGGMGTVWAATHTLTRSRVAIKFLKPEYAQKREVVQRFMREARAAIAVRHPNVVTIHDVLQLDDGTPAMVMDFLAGESLAQKLARERVLPLDVMARTLLPAISAVGTAHSLGIVHRDLKPDNLFVVINGDTTTIKVLDFGIAKLTATEGEAATTGALTKTGSVLGTPYYMSPEQAFGERDIDFRSDIWSFGVILYECLSGRRPTEGDNLGQVFKIIATGKIPPPSSIIPNIPPEMDALVMRMLQRERTARPQSLNEVRLALQKYSQEHMASIPMPIARVSLTDPGASGPSLGSAANTPMPAFTPAPHERVPTSRTMSAVNIASDPQPAKSSSVGLLVGLGVFVLTVSVLGGGAYEYQRRHKVIANQSAPSAVPSSVARDVVVATAASAIAAAPSASSSVVSASATSAPSPSATHARVVGTTVTTNAQQGGHANGTANNSTPTTTTATPAATASAGRGPGGLVSETPF